MTARGNRVRSGTRARTGRVQLAVADMVAVSMGEQHGVHVT